METLKIRDKEFVPFISAEEIDQAVTRVASQLEENLGDKEPLFLVILNGAFMFASDLMKKFNSDADVSFVKLASYAGTETTNKVKELIGIREDLTDRHVVIVEDIIDTGITMESLLEQLSWRKPASISVATFLFKPDAFVKDYKIDYIGMDIPNKFIVGYGLDYDGRGRNLPDIYQIKE